MKIVVAIDSLKGSLSSLEAGKAVKEGILRALPTAQVLVKPIADGGEGTAQVLTEGMGGEMVSVVVSGPLGQPVTASYGILPQSGIALLEMAQAAGITLSPVQKPEIATTFGVGEMILDALHRGYRKFIVGIGGSATNDGGVGMLQALGVAFLNKAGEEIPVGALALLDIEAITLEKIHPLLKDCTFEIACDVTNPLCGENGATYVYGPQKGVSEAQKPIFDSALAHYAEKTEALFELYHREAQGAGAAGGLGFAFLSYLGGTLHRGTALVLRAIHLEEDLQGADLVFTGEGQLDRQTVMGKAPGGVAALAKAYGCKVVALAGSVTADARDCHQGGIDAYFSILSRVVTLEEALDTKIAYENMALTAEQILRLLR